MPGTWSKAKTVVSGETITASDRNTEFDKVITEADPDGVGDASANTTEMQATTDPFPASSESLATDLRGELRRLRFQIELISSTLKSSVSQWYNDPPTSGNIEINDSGWITQPNQPSFLATAAANTADQTGDGTAHTVEFDAEVYDLNSDFNTGTFTFAAPVTGKYLLIAKVKMTGLASATDGTELTIVTSNRNYTVLQAETELVAKGIECSCIADMDSSDTATVSVVVGNGNKSAEVADSVTNCNFSGSLIN